MYFFNQMLFASAKSYPYFFTIHYYLLLKIPTAVLVKSEK